MKVKKILLIFLIGLIAGVGLSPFAVGKPRDFLASPISISLAETNSLALPMPEEKVLGEANSIASQSDDFQHLRQKPKTIALNKQAVPSAVDKPLTALEISLRNYKKSNSSEKEKNLTQTSQNNTAPPASSNKRQLTIAVLGDSMVDTMGEYLPYIDSALKNYYPNYFFNLLNYGAGGTNIEYGVQRLTSGYDYLGKSIPSLVSTNPDIVIIESFAYNPWGGEQSDLDRQWLAMAKAVDIIKSQTHAKILFLSTIAPSKTQFGQGPGGINWSSDQAYEHAQKIEKYLQNTIYFANSQGYPLVDAYHPSIVNGDGNLSYISAHDHIHPSVAGCQLIAGLVAKKLVSLGWL